jgi:hypothetical protein
MLNDPDAVEKPLGNPICLHCAAELIGYVQFCPKCGCPVTPEAVSMPYESVLARGFAAREGSSRPRKLIVVIGMWLMFGPMFAMLASVFVTMLVVSQGVAWQAERRGEIPGILLGLAVSAGLAAIPGALLYKTTKNHVKQRREVSEEQDDDDLEHGHEDEDQK